MSTPKQAKLARSGRSPVSPSSAKDRRGVLGRHGGHTGRVPPGNQPGHHPDHEQDKPRTRHLGLLAETDSAPKSDVAIAAATVDAEPEPSAVRAFPFAYHRAFVLPALALGITPGRCRVDMDHEELVVRFGWWSLRTRLDNIAEVEVTNSRVGPPIIGSPRVWPTRGGVTFATTAGRGVRIRLHRPVAAVEPFGLVRHGSVTVTVDEPEALHDALQERLVASRHEAACAG